jgi:hypothetical protein
MQRTRTRTQCDTILMHFAVAYALCSREGGTAPAGHRRRGAGIPTLSAPAQAVRLT